MAKIKVMLCDKETPENARIIFNDSWVCEEKYDGVRAIITQGNVFSGRSGRLITAQFPEFDASVFPPDDVIDGEIVCNGDFGMTQRRVLTKNPTKIRLMSKHSPSRFMAFDYLANGSNSVYVERRQLLSVSVGSVDWIDVSRSGDFDSMWQCVLDEALEGVIMKRKDSLYEHGKRSSSWVKVKAFLETEAIFTKLDKHTHGVRLETPDGKSVNVNGAKAKDVEREFNKNKYVKCHVQYMEFPDSDAWRFPSFRGLA